ncbi:MAG: DNA translocase FtsK [Bacteroidales bacterium]|nr:DNA translocase FtsK [Bacteroidales bacterium]
MKEERTRVTCGVLLLCFTVYLLFAFVSYLFTGAADQSLLYVDEHLQWDGQIVAFNWTGVHGAYLAELFINNGFGLASFLLLFFLSVLSLSLLDRKIMPLWKAFIYTSFGMLWFSIALAFSVQPFLKNSFLYFGGKEGDAVCGWLCTNFGGWGTFIILFVTALVFSIFAFDCVLPYLKNLFAKREPAPVVESKPLQGTVEEPVVGQEDGPYLAEEPVENPETEPEEPFEPEIPEEDDGNETNGYDGGDNDDNGGENIETIDDGFIIENTSSDDTLSEEERKRILDEQGEYNPRLDLPRYKLPPLSLLKTYPNENVPIINNDEQIANKDRIKNTLQNYGIEIDTVKATVGPTITLYEIVPKPGVRISKIRSLENDIMLSLSAMGIRIIAPIPGKGTIGIEVPNEKPQIVSMHSVIASKRFQEENKYALPVALGRTITNDVFMFDLAKSPHLLVAGATGQGKSVGLNAIITSLLYKKHPAELKFVLVDPKMVEFSIYAALEKHFMASMPDSENIIITDSSKVISTLNSLVIEMEDRYKLLMSAKCRNIVEYNEKFITRRLNPNKGHRFLPYIVIVIDEFGDFIMVAGKEVETPIARITQKARAVGMHMILATQRPSVNIITGVIKANVPGRIAFKVASQIDSRTILDASGANQLVGKGDLLYLQNSDLVRVQCAFVDTPEVEALVEYVSNQQSYSMPYQLPEYKQEENGGADAFESGDGNLMRFDAKLEEAARIVVQQGRASTSYLQQILELGFNRAARVMSQLERLGIVGPAEGSKPRKVLVDEMGLEDILLRIKQS